MDVFEIIVMFVLGIIGFKFIFNDGFGFLFTSSKQHKIDFSNMPGVSEIIKPKKNWSKPNKDAFVFCVIFYSLLIILVAGYLIFK